MVGLLGPALDRGKGASRWEHWRPSVALCQHEDLLIHRFELLSDEKHLSLARTVADDVHAVAPETEVRIHTVSWKDPWDFEEVFSGLLDFCRHYPFDPEEEDYLVHITTGTHVAQICLFLLTESRHLPARLIQTSPPRRKHQLSPGTFTCIDLDLARYDGLATRFQAERDEGRSLLKSGIATRNPEFNRLIDEMERVVIHSKAPVLLAGPTGAGKSLLARRIFELKAARHQLDGPFVEVNCATLRGEGAMSALFGHVKGAFTGALASRPGLLARAHRGVLFLDELGELGGDEQAMLLRAIEDGRFLPVGSDDERESDFQLLAGSNRNLREEVAKGRFREDLLARIDVWTYRLPGLAKRPEDIEPNLDWELDRATERTGLRVTMNKEARARFLRFSTSPEALWRGNFRDFNAAVTRMATLARGGRITVSVVDGEIERLRGSWREGRGEKEEERDLLVACLGSEAFEETDPFDRVQLALVIRTLRRARNLSEAGRILFAASRKRKSKTNDADRLRKYLQRFDLDWRNLVAARDPDGLS